MRLARAAEQITLLDVYRAVVDDKRMLVPRPDVLAVCVISRNIGSFFDSLAAEAESGLSDLLSQKTIAQSLGAIRRLDDGAA